MTLPARRKTPLVVTPTAPADAIMQASTLTFPLSPQETEVLVRAALEEDQAFNDITTLSTVVTSRRARGSIVSRHNGVIAGMPLAVAAFRTLDSKLTVRVDATDGMEVQKDASVMYMSGHARPILSAERVALNFLQKLSGIASMTRQFVNAVHGTGAKILDTRKTTPGWRALEKYAVRAGGGENHRMNLADAVLIKDNHLVSVNGDIGRAVKRAREYTAGTAVRVEVECDSVDQVRAALDAGADIIMLDNMSLRNTAASVKLGKGRAILEASGGISLENVRAVAERGVDWISIGALTHSYPALDLALDFDAS